MATPPVTAASAPPQPEVELEAYCYEPVMNECAHCETEFTGEPGGLCWYCGDYTNGRCYSPQPFTHTCLGCHNKFKAYDGCDSCDYCGICVDDSRDPKQMKIHRNMCIVKGIYPGPIVPIKQFLTHEEQNTLNEIRL